MKLCGATDEFVRRPFVIEGAFQGFSSAALSLMLLMIGFLVLRERLDSSLAALTGIETAFLPPLLMLCSCVSPCRYLCRHNIIYR